jgi:DNA-binding PadR family transcriptional regulator
MTSNASARTGFNDALILSALSAGCEYGLEVMEKTGLSSGTVYPALRRLESGGLVEADWEVEERAHAAGRPARRYYRLTVAGERAMEEAVARINAQQRALGWGQS